MGAAQFFMSNFKWFFLNPNSPENVRERIAFSKKLLNELTTLDSSEITSPFSIGKVVG